MIVFTVNEHKNICRAGLNRQAAYATDFNIYQISSLERKKKYHVW